VKYYACNVAHLGAGRDIGTDLAVWTGVAPAFPQADRLFTASPSQMLLLLLLSPFTEIHFAAAVVRDVGRRSKGNWKRLTIKIPIRSNLPSAATPITFLD
jgi:hypothetical protein